MDGMQPCADSARFSNLMERIQPGAAAVWPFQQLDGEYETWCCHAAHFSNLMERIQPGAGAVWPFQQLDEEYEI